MINNQEEATIMEAREGRTTQVEEVRNVMEKIELNKGQDDPLSKWSTQATRPAKVICMFVCIVCFIFGVQAEF